MGAVHGSGPAAGARHPGRPGGPCPADRRPGPADHADAEPRADRRGRRRRDIDTASRRLVEVITGAVEKAGEGSGRSRLSRPAGTTAALVQALGPTLRALLSPASRRVVVFDGDPVRRGVHRDGGRARVRAGWAADARPDRLRRRPAAAARPRAASRRTQRRRPRPAAWRAMRRTASTPRWSWWCPASGCSRSGDTWAAADTARHIYLDALRVGEAANRLGRRPPPGRRRTPVHRGLGGRGIPQADRRRRCRRPAARPAGSPSSRAPRRASAWRSPRISSPRAPTSSSPISTSRSRRTTRPPSWTRFGPGRAMADRDGRHRRGERRRRHRGHGAGVRRPRPPRLQRGRAAGRRGHGPAARRLRPRDRGSTTAATSSRQARGARSWPRSTAPTPTGGATSSRSTRSPAWWARRATAPTPAASSAASA